MFTYFLRYLEDLYNYVHAVNQIVFGAYPSYKLCKKRNMPVVSTPNETFVLQRPRILQRWFTLKMICASNQRWFAVKLWGMGIKMVNHFNDAHSHENPVNLHQFFLLGGTEGSTILRSTAKVSWVAGLRGMARLVFSHQWIHVNSVG